LYELMTMSKLTGGEKQEPLIAARAERIAIVLGRTREVDMKAIVERAQREFIPLAIINLGFPLTPSQQKVVDAALAAAGTGAIELDAMIAYDARQAAALLHRNDDVIFATSRRERRRVARVRTESR
jgi:hypothetical protein